jgi:hypothetical protein
MNENKRPLKFMLGTLLAGLIIAGGMYLYNKGLEAQTSLQNTQLTTPNTNDSENCQTEIQNKINGLKYIRDISPSDYNAVLMEITSSVEAECFPQVTADMFTRRLNDEYSSLMISKLKTLINEQDPVDFVEIKDYLTHLKSLNIVRADIRTIEEDLYQIEHYSVTLPNKAIDFTNTTSFDDLQNDQSYIDLFNEYYRELSEKPNLQERFSQKKSITEACSNAIERMNEYATNYRNYVSRFYD